MKNFGLKIIFGLLFSFSLMVFGNFAQAYPTINFSVSPSTVIRPSVITLTWSTSNAVSCTANSSNGSWSGAKALNGSETVNVSAPATYTSFTLSCKDEGGATLAYVKGVSYCVLLTDPSTVCSPATNGTSFCSKTTGVPASCGSTTYCTNGTKDCCTGYNYSSWGVCSSGMQTRTINSTISSTCSDGVSPVLSQSCIECTGYNYSPWGACSGGIQTRTVISSTPVTCVPGISPVLSQACTCTSFSYTPYSLCSDSTNTRTRSVTSSYPSGCTGGNPITTDYCTNGKCNPIYNGKTFATIPATGLCSAGTQSPSSVTTPGPWNWSCVGMSGGQTRNCYTNLLGSCGADNGQNLYSTPTNLCLTGAESSVSGDGSAVSPWSWTCEGVSCSARKKYSCSNICSNIYDYATTAFDSYDASCSSSIDGTYTYTQDCACGEGKIAGDGLGYAAVCSAPTVPTATMQAPLWDQSIISSVGALGAKLRFYYNDPNGKIGSAYRIMIAEKNGSVIFDQTCGAASSTPGCKDFSNSCLKSDSLSCDYLVDKSLLGYSKNYNWYVQVWNQSNTPSLLTQYNNNSLADTDKNIDNDPQTFSTFSHEFPAAIFTFNPEKINAGQLVQFDASLSSTSPTYGPLSYDWSFTNANIGSATSIKPAIKFNSAGGSTVSLTVTDNAGYKTSTSTTILIKNKLPSWQEVKPQ
ncbi:MAG: Agarase [Parcubacteria group bacterium GW2011_GWE2_38_18]|nr:MAG: Agarase [Parcubacteria group bacterium GW2011_GWE2_38_18]